MVPAVSDRISRVPPYSGLYLGSTFHVYWTFTLFGRFFQTVPLPVFPFLIHPTTPTLPKHRRFGLFPFRSPLLWKSLLFSLPPGIEMFQFPGFAFVFQRISRWIGMGCPIRKSTDQWLFAPPRSLSQLITSFFASRSQGIPRTLLLTFFFWILVSYYSFSLWFHSFSQHVKELSLP